MDMSIQKIFFQELFLVEHLEMSNKDMPMDANGVNDIFLLFFNEHQLGSGDR